MVHHAQPALDCQIIKTEYIRPLHAEQEDHFRGPYANPPEGGKRGNRIRIRHMPDLFQIKRAILDLAGKIQDIFRLAERDAARLQACRTGGYDGFRVNCAERFPHPVPDGSLGFGGYLLPDNMVDDRGKQVGVGLTADRTDLVDQRAQSGVFLFQIIRFRFAVLKIQVADTSFAAGSYGLHIDSIISQDGKQG